MYILTICIFSSVPFLQLSLLSILLPTHISLEKIRSIRGENEAKTIITHHKYNAVTKEMVGWQIL